MRPTRRGFTLTEMLFIIMLLGVAALMSARLFTGSMRVISSAPKPQESHAAVDRMIFVLRNDVWNASRIEVIDGNNVVLTKPDGAVVRLRLGSADITRSTNREKQESHFTTGVRLAAIREGGWLVLRSTDAGDELRFVSQLLTSKDED